MLFRVVCTLCLLLSLEGVAQSNLPWQDLPQVNGTKAFIYHTKLRIDSLLREERLPKVKEVYSGEHFLFSKTIVPDTLNIDFVGHDLPSAERIPLPNGMLFKDLSTHNIKYLDKAHGLPGKELSAIAEDKDGLIYLGFENCLAQFNGTELKVYRGIPEFLFQEIRSLFYDSYQRLWIGTATGVAYLYEGKLYLPKTNIFGSTHLAGFNENQETGEVFVFTIYTGLFILKNQRWVNYAYQLPTNSISAAMRSQDGKLWIAFGNGGAAYIKEDSLFQFKREGVSNTPRSLIEYEGEVYLGLFMDRLLKCRNDSLFYVLLDDQKVHKIYSMASNEYGLWLADYGKGVYLIKKNKEIVQFDSQDGLVGNSAFMLMIDDYQHVWVADPYNGLSKIDENIFYKSRKYFKGKLSDLEIDKSNIWYFTDRGLFRESGDFVYEYKSVSNHLEHGILDKEKLWVTSVEQGLTSLENGEFTHYIMKPNFQLDSTIYAIQMDDEGAIWGYDFAKRLHKFKDGIFYNYSKHPAWKDWKFTKVLSTLNGTIFALTNSDGVIAIKNGQFVHLTIDNILPSNTISHVFEDSKGRFWYCYKGQIQITKTDGSSTLLKLPSSNISAREILEYKPNGYLLVSEEGILNIEEFESRFNFTWYGKEHGLNMVGNSFVGQDLEGNILIGGGGHTMYFDPYFLERNNSTPKLSLNRILINDSISTTPNKINIKQNVPLKYVFNSIGGDNTVTLFYKLERGNRSGKWSSTLSNEIHYNELAHGEYKLSVYAQVGTKQSEQLYFNLQVLPHWYQTTLFIISTLFGTIFLIVIYFILQKRKAVRIQKQLERLVEVRTIELSHEKNQVVKQLKEKEILRQEVHHRVKNNLTFLKSLLYLRSRASSTEEVKMVLNECQARIETIALVHQKLYDMENVTEVNFNTFIKELFLVLHSLFDIEENVQLELESDAELKMEMKLSVFIGLILNELITNSFKYAFSKAESGKIFIKIKDVENAISIEYSDSGAGLQDGFELQNSHGFGFKLINILVQQTDAQMTYLLKTFQLTVPK